MAKRNQQKKHLPRFFVVLFLAVFIGAGAFILNLPVWEIKEVVVNGARLLSPDEIKTLSSIPLFGNLFFTSFARAKSNLSNITAIQSCRFYRIPPKTVLISIKERAPIAAVVFPQKSFVVDKEGYLLNRNENISLNIPNLADLPVISGIDEAEVLKSGRVKEQTAAVIDHIIGKLAAFLALKSMQIELGGLENMSLLLDDLLRVKIGNTEDIKQKMDVFLALLPVVSGKWSQVEYVDVRYPANPVIRYK